MSAEPSARHAGQDVEPVLEALLEDLGRDTVPVADSCMRPAVEPGDVALIVPFLGLPRPGQIVAARVDGMVEIRRLRRIEMRDGRRLYSLGGDAPGCTGSTVRREDLLGRVGAIVRKGRRLEMDPGPGAPVGRVSR